MKILVAYDGTLNAKAALRYGLRKLREEGGSIVVLQVFDTGMFVGYGAGPSAESAARREANGRLEEARAIIAETGITGWIRVEQLDGDPETVTIDYASERHFNAVLAPARFKPIVSRALCPVILFPGHIIVPVDTTGYTRGAVDRIVAEAAETGSKAVIAGIVPVHIYGAAEEAEERRVEAETHAVMDALASELRGRGVDTVAMMRKGYPDEEIMRVMREFSASMIMIPAVEDMPSELSKAVNIIRDEPDTFTKPLLLTTAAVL